MNHKMAKRTPLTSLHNPISIDAQYILEGLNRLGNTLTKHSDDTTESASNITDKLTNQLSTLNTFIAIDIDSSRRNRNQYPLSSNFVIPYTNASPGSNIFNSLEPITNAFPYESGLTQAGSTVNMIILSATSSSLDNFYINNVLDISGQYVQITNYIGSTQTATINPPLTIAPPIGTSYQIRRAIPIAKGTLQPGSTPNALVLPATFSSINEYYVGNFIRLDSGPTLGQTRIIMNYNGTTKIAILSTSLSSAPGADLFEIDGFSYDNMTPLRYSGSRALSQPVCYAVILRQLTIPNLTLKVGYGGKISNYPYLYVHFYNDIKHTETIIYGNNPAGTLATFRVSMNSPSIASTLAVHPPNFFVFDTVNILAPELMKFSPSESIRFRVTLPNGEDLQFIQPDSPSPSPSDPFVQISALINIRRLA